jgi:benzoyl-CoA 2,3-dioxygenase component B
LSSRQRPAPRSFAIIHGCSRLKADVAGNEPGDAEWEKRRGEFLPSDPDRDFIESLMKPQTELGKFASWIAPPKVGIDNKPGEFEYVKIA